jgi:uncharacterized protein
LSKVIWLMLLVALPVWGQPILPKPDGWVYDAANVLDAATKAQLNALAADVAQQTSAEIAVVVVGTTAPQTPKQYVTALFNRWGVGKRGADNGVMILLAVQDRRVEIETGYGVEGILPDGKVGEIIRTAMLPHLRQQSWGAGLVAGAQRIAQVLRQDSPAAPVSTATPDEPAFPYRGLVIALALVALMLLLIGLVVRRRHRCPKCGAQVTRQGRTLQTATYQRSGLRELVYDCPQCAHHDVRFVAIPPRVRVSRRGRLLPGGVIIGGGGLRGGGSFGGRAGSGGFSGFGGGSSGGGGAGASF